MSRSQLTMFMILGFVVLISGLVFYALQGGPAAEFGSAPREVVGAARSQFESCMTSFMSAAVVVFGLEGGQLLRVEDGGVVLPVRALYDRGQNVLPSVKEWESILGEAAGKGVGECAGNVSLSGVRVAPGVHREEVVLADDAVHVLLRSPLVLRGAEYRVVLSEVSVSVPVRLRSMHAAASTILRAIVKDSEVIPFSVLQEQGFVVKVVKQDEQHFLYMLRDEQALLNGQPYEFMFAAEFGDETAVVENHPEFLNGRETFRLKVGVPFLYSLEVQSKLWPRFVDDTDLFSVSEVGNIAFTPMIEQVGIHLVNIVARTEEGDASTQLLFIIEQ